MRAPTTGAAAMNTLFQRDPSLIEQREPPPTHDRAPDGLAEGTPGWRREDLTAILGEAQVLSRAIDLTHPDA
jgi:D-lactate dehydrogenase